MRIGRVEQGQGPAVLFLPGSFSTTAAWSAIWSILPEGFRLISANLPGYAGQPDPRKQGGNDMSRLVDWTARLIDEIGDEVHLVGHSFGGQIALAAALHGVPGIRSLLGFEANPVFARPDGAAPHSWHDEVSEVPDRLRQARDAGRDDPASVVIDYWTAPGRFHALPAKIREFCNAGVEANIRDWDSALSFTPWLSEFRALKLPCTLAWGALASRPIAEINSALAASIPGTRKEVVEGADHFLITDRPHPCAALVLAHLDRAGAG